MTLFFDVFDTVVTRRCGGPDSVLWLVGRELMNRELTKVSPVVFAKLRRQTEARLYARKEIGAGTKIEEIYQDLEAAGIVRVGCAAQAVGLENDLEIENCLPVPGIRERLELARQQGAVAFVSDMYLSESTVRGILEKSDLLSPRDRLFVSSEAGVWKKDGQLFDHALKALGEASHQACHYGNDKVSDIEGAKRAGVPAVFLGAANLSIREAFWDQKGPESMGLGAVLAGASRQVRLEAKHQKRSDYDLVEVAASVAAPALTIFILWVLQKAEADGVKKLFFLSRDGQILLKVAEVLARRCGIQIELEYLHASRQSWFLPSLYDCQADSFNWVLRAARTLRVEEFFAVIGLDADEINSADQWNASDALVLDQGKWTPFGEALLEKEEFKNLILRAAEQRRQLVQQYFTEQGIVAGARIAFVDLGWSGSIQRMGQAISGLSELRAYYLGLRSDDTPVGAVAYLNSLFQPSLESVVPLVEGFCFADHPSVVGFESQNSIVPVYGDSIATERICSWGLGEFQAAILRVVNVMKLDEGNLNGVVSMQSSLLKFLMKVNQSPTFAEAQVLCSQPWEDGVGSFAASLPRGGRLAFIEFLRIILRIDTKHLARARWLRGSVCLSGRLVRWAWASIVFLKKVRNRFFYV